MSARKRGRTAGELLDELESDPKYRERQRRWREEAEKNRAAYRDAASGLIAELRRAGYRLDTISDLRQTGDQLAVPILTLWLPIVSYPPLKWDIVKMLGSPWARPHAARPLIDEYRRLRADTDPLTDDVRFSIGDALERVADDSVADDLIALARDPTYGSQRGLIVMALGNLKKNRARALSTLRELLSDENVVMYALMGLRKLGDPSARADVERFVTHPNKMTRREAKKALAKLT